MQVFIILELLQLNKKTSNTLAEKKAINKQFVKKEIQRSVRKLFDLINQSKMKSWMPARLANLNMYLEP